MIFSQFIQKYGNAYDHPITLVNVKEPDLPLLYVNEAFLEMTQYELSDVIGKNCRFLQGEKTDRVAVKEIRIAIKEFLPLNQDIINYKKNGELFYNRIVLLPFKEEENCYFIGLQHEISEVAFKPENRISKYVLFDRLMNPLTVLSSAVRIQLKLDDKVDIERIKKDYIQTFKSIRDFILSA